MDTELNKTTQWSISVTPSLEAISMLYYLQSAGEFHWVYDYKTDRRDYDTYLLAYSLKGIGKLTYREKEYYLKPGDCFLIDCKDHQIYQTVEESDWDFIWVHFKGSNTKSFYHKIYRNSGPVYKLRKESIIPGNIVEIIDLLKNSDVNTQFIASKLIVEILTELVISNAGSKGEVKGENKHLEQVLELIEGSYNNNISLDDMADKAKMSKYHFSRLFKNHTGYSPHEYLKKYRINVSKDLLKMTNSSINEISYKVGFESTSHFIKTFKEAENVTPKTFRNYWR